ncbi:MAG: FAD-binding protein [Clostridia bacterium]|nr:FAD-binding protein [Clostridia bacterium]
MKTITLSTAIVGVGAAGYNAALRLHKLGEQDIAIFCLAKNNSTSRNTGSDKQTYYKMSLAGSSPDSPAAMAEDLFGGRCVDGDHALIEAALSSRCFLQLAELGVPFPTNRYGEYVGYQTDHDTRGRATSAGPLTSKLMTECLQREVEARGVPTYEHMQIVKIIPFSEDTLGLIALCTNVPAEDEENRFTLVCCKNVIWATGGPAGIYAESVYPLGHTGTTGVPLAAGATAKNLTEWQYGLASVNPRWNVSGTYMQVLPRFVSVDPDGTEHEFLHDFYPNLGDCLSRIFRKGYEWPFDSRKAQNGSSVIDLLVFRETKLYGRRVYLDFRSNPQGLQSLPYDALDADARAYLESAGACFGTPIERLRHMNQPAIELYQSKGLDITKEMLEIALCAQHNNGGIDVDLWWQTCIPGLFAVGEAAGTHGVYRPGGSALNAGQVGSLRAAQYIARHRSGLPTEAQAAAFFAASEGEMAAQMAFTRAILSDEDNTRALLNEHCGEMSACAAAIRNVDGMRALMDKNISLLANFSTSVSASNSMGLSRAYRLQDTLLSQNAYLCAMISFAERSGLSRGSAIYSTAQGIAAKGLENDANGLFCYELDDGTLDALTQTVSLSPDGSARADWRPVRPLPEGGGFFENVWRGYRENGNVF